MKRLIQTWVRTSATAVATTYFFTNVALAYTSEKNYWTDRRRHIESKNGGQEDNLFLAALPATTSSAALFQSLQSPSRSMSALSDDLAKTLPLSVTAGHAKLFSALETTHGTIRKVWLPAHNAGDRVVVHIQDVHQNEDAQRHIGGTVESLMKAGQAGVVGLEGSFDPIDVKAYHDFDNREVIRLTADYLLKENKITGPVHAAMATHAPLAPMLGIDDPTHYKANVDAYRQAAPKVEVYKKAWATLKISLTKEKKAVFSSDLLAFDSRVQAYHEGDANLAEYVEALAPEKSQGNARLLAQAFEMEKKLDFNRVEADRKEMIEALVKTLSQDQINHLIQESTAYRLGEIRYGEFYVYLKNICHGAKIDLAQFPHMESYIRYVLLSDQIDAEKLLTELAELEKARYGVLAKTSEEKILVFRSRALGLAGRLLTFELTPEDWSEYGVLNAGTALGLDMSSFEAFYREAHIRDEFLATNLLKAMDDRRSKTAVLVTGGYHTNGVSERLVKSGVTVVTFTPRIEKIDSENGSAYLSVFTQEKTPLEKLFAGEKLFLGGDAFSPANQNLAALAAAGAAGTGENGSPAMVENTFRKLAGKATRFWAQVENSVVTVQVWASNIKESVRVIVERTSEGTLSVQQTVVVAISVATIAATMVPILSFGLSSISTSFVSLGSIVPGVSFFTTLLSALVAVITGQEGHFVSAFSGWFLDGVSVAAVSQLVTVATALTLMTVIGYRRFVPVLAMIAPAMDLNPSPKNENRPILKDGEDTGAGIYRPRNLKYWEKSTYNDIFYFDKSEQPVPLPKEEVEQILWKSLFIHVRASDVIGMFGLASQRKVVHFLDDLRRHGYGTVASPLVQEISLAALNELFKGYVDPTKGYGTANFSEWRHFRANNIEGKYDSKYHTAVFIGRTEFRMATQWWDQNKSLYAWDGNTALGKLVASQLSGQMSRERDGYAQDWESATVFLRNLRTAAERNTEDLVDSLTEMFRIQWFGSIARFDQIVKVLKKAKPDEIVRTVHELTAIIKMKELVRLTAILEVFGQVNDLASVHDFVAKVEKLKEVKSENEVVEILEDYFKEWVIFQKGADAFLNSFMEKEIDEKERNWYTESKHLYTSYSYLDNTDKAVETSADDVNAILKKSRFIHVRPTEVQFMFLEAPQKIVTRFLNSLRVAGFGTVGSPLIMEIDQQTLASLWAGFKRAYNDLGFIDWKFFMDATINGQKGLDFHVTKNCGNQDFRFVPEWWSENQYAYTWDYNTPLGKIVGDILRLGMFSQMNGYPQDWNSMKAFLINLQTAPGNKSSEFQNAVIAMSQYKDEWYGLQFVQILKILAKADEAKFLDTVLKLNTIMQMRGLRETQILDVFVEAESLDSVIGFVSKVEQMMNGMNSTQVQSRITDFLENGKSGKNPDAFLNSFNPAGQPDPNSLLFLLTGKNAALGAVIDGFGLMGVGLALSLFLLGPALAFPVMALLVLPIFAGGHVYAKARKNPEMGLGEMIAVFTRSYLLALPYLLTVTVPFLDLDHGSTALLMAIPAAYHLISDAIIMGRRDAKALGQLFSMDPKSQLEALMGPIGPTTDVFAPSIRTIERMAKAQSHPVLGFVYRMSFKYFAPAEVKSAIKRGLDLNQGNLVNALLQHRTVAPAAGVLPEATLIGMTITQEGMIDLPDLLRSLSDNNTDAEKKQYIVLTPGEGVSAKELSNGLGENNPYARIAEGGISPTIFVENVRSAMGDLNLNPVTTSIVMLSAPEFENAREELEKLLVMLASETGIDSALRRRIAEAFLKTFLAPFRMSVHDLLMMYQASQLAETSA